MAYEILRSIVETETHAKQIKKQAADQAEGLQTEAHQKGKALFAEAQAEGKENLQRLTEEAVAESRVEVDKIEAKTQNACSELAKHAAEKKDEAVRAVIRKVVGTDGDR